MDNTVVPFPRRPSPSPKAKSSTPLSPRSSSLISLTIAAKLLEIERSDPEYVQRWGEIIDKKLRVERLHNRWAADGTE